MAGQRAFFDRLRRDCTGSALIEFAILCPSIVVMLLGVLQVGLAMQNYNALRSVSADVARYAVVNYQTKVDPNSQTINNFALSRATLAPYGLSPSRLNITLTDVTTTDMVGVKQKSMTMIYAIPSFMSIIGMDDIPITYTRQLYLVSN